MIHSELPRCLSEPLQASCRSSNFAFGINRKSKVTLRLKTLYTSSTVMPSVFLVESERFPAQVETSKRLLILTGLKRVGGHHGRKVIMNVAHQKMKRTEENTSFFV